MTTRRPTAMSVSGPAASTIPAASCPSSMGTGRARVPSTTDRSEWHSPAASIRTRISPGPGGSSSSGPMVTGRDVVHGGRAPQRSSTAPVICTTISSSLSPVERRQHHTDHPVCGATRRRPQYEYSYAYTRFRVYECEVIPVAKRRKVGNLMALAVLAILTHRPMHPYEMAQFMRGWGKDRDMPVKWGSLYSVVDRMVEHGLLEEAGTSREGRRPERTTYRITEAGRAELIDWTRELLSVAEREFPRSRAGLSVMAALPPDEVAALLRRRLAALEAETAELREAIAASERVPR